MKKYQDIYPSSPIQRSSELLRPSAGDLLMLEYFEADPGSMPRMVFDQHHILINLNDTPHRVENWRDGEHRDFTYQKNEIVVTPAGVESGWTWHIQSKVIVITLEPGKLERFAQLELGIVLSAKQLQSIPQFVDKDLTDAAIMVWKALETPIGSDVMFESLARVFLTKLILKYGLEQTEQLAFTESFTAHHYQRVLDLVSRRYADPIAVEDMAAEVGISPFHFSRLFKRTIGHSPHQFLMMYRVERSKEKMRDSDRTLIDIALACGFADQPHFTRTFKRFEGVTPKQHRQAR